jgi:hypothetical protein
MLAGEFRMLDVERAGVRLLFGNADLRQEVDQHLGLDLKFARQFVDSYLIRVCHAPLVYGCSPVGSFSGASSAFNLSAWSSSVATGVSEPSETVSSRS